MFNKTKKSRYLFIMLTVLIAHTVVLSMWLTNSEPVQKHANFKTNQHTEKSLGLIFTNVEPVNSKDSVTVSPSVLNSLRTKFK